MSESKHTPGPWFLSGVRYKMNGGEWHNVNRYDEALKRDENIACVGFDPRTGVGLEDARLIAAAPELLAALKIAADIIGHPDDDMSKHIREVIAKAEGRS